jgi:hypothetical protein
MNPEVALAAIAFLNDRFQEFPVQQQYPKWGRLPNGSFRPSLSKSGLTAAGPK